MNEDDEINQKEDIIYGNSGHLYIEDINNI